MKLTVENVETVFKDCLFKDEEIVNGQPPADFVKVEGIVQTFGFHPGRLAAHRDDIKSMLEELPEPFQAKGGGGWSFLNACMTKDDVQWGEQRNVEQLLVLGIGSKLATILLPRDLWSVLPGGVPYFSVGEQPSA